MNRQLLITVVFSLVFTLVGCASTPEADAAGETASARNEADPWEGMNRATYRFNDTLDRWLMKPLAQGYKKVTPDIVESGVSNFIRNLDEVNNIINNALQWKWARAGNDSGRFLINSTLGIGGIMDIAQYAGLKRTDRESFGQTFSYWGIPHGPYLVLPFLGPSTVSDTAGLPLYWETNPVSHLATREAQLGVLALGLLDVRARLLDAEGLIQGDQYILIRDAYLQRREYLVNDGQEDLDAFEEDFEGFDDF